MRLSASLVAGTALLFGLGITTQSLASEEYAQLLARASESLNRFDKDNWAYTETSVRSDGVFVARYDARRSDGARWTLDFVDDRAPTDEEREKFVTRKREAEASSGENDDDLIENMVKIPTLKLIEETESYWLFSFEPQGDGDDEGFMEHVDGELKIAKEDVHIASIELRSSEPFKPGFGIKVHEFLTTMQFAPITNTEQVAPQSVDFRIKARAFVVKNIDEQSTIAYSDYEFLAD